MSAKRKRGDPVWVARDKKEREWGVDCCLFLDANPSLNNEGTWVDGEGGCEVLPLTYEGLSKWFPGIALRKGQKKRVRIRVEEVSDAD